MSKYENYTKEELIEEIKRLKQRKKFGLVWEDKPEQVVADCENNFPVLQEITKRAIDFSSRKDAKAQSTKEHNNLFHNPSETVGERSRTTTHLIIEGDNYHALSVLNVTHKGKIDVIYIDPPYNTGAKDWKYNNDYVDGNDAYRHSKWLSFMTKRLLLAKELLSQNGVLICTIDKYEQSNLGVLLNELFANKEIVCITIIHNPGGIQGKNFSHTNEYAFFVYPQNGVFITTTFRDDVPLTAFRDWGKETALRTSAKTCFYPILVKNDEIIGFGDICNDEFHPQSANLFRQDEVIEVYPLDEKGVEMKWRFGRETVEQIKNELQCKKIKGKYSIFRKKTDYRWKTVWTDVKYNANVYGTKLLGYVFNSEFPYPKSLFAVMDCIKAVVHNKTSANILDFFAGSGTTGHAVLELNKEDGGNRQFILCTNNENKICEEVTYPRIKTVITGKRPDGSTYSEGIPASVRYFKTDFIEKSEDTDENRVKLTERCHELLQIKEGCYDEITTIVGANCSSPLSIKFYHNPTKLMVVIFDRYDNIPDSEYCNVIKSVHKQHNHNNQKNLSTETVVYRFSIDGNLDMDISALPNARLEEIPEEILKVYNQIFKKKRKNKTINKLHS